MKKKGLCNIDRRSCCLSRLIRIMKLTTFLLLLTFIGVQASVYSQTSELNLKVQNTTVKDVLREIEDQSEFFFMYNDRKVDVNRKVSLEIRQQGIDDVLQSLFEGSSTNYVIRDRQIVLFNEDEKQALRGGNFNLLQAVQSVSGTVTDEKGDPLPGVTVVIKGTTMGTITDIDGRYQLSNLPENAILLFSFVGMETQEIPVKQPRIDVVLSEGTIGLDEVVAVGYGTMKKSDVTGSMVSVNSEKLNSRPVSNAFEALQGKAAGVDITSNERPGEIGKITIRGMRSMIQNSSGTYVGNTPLYVVDGVPLMSSSGIETLNPRDIESIDILKDASATAIYGSRGANGVVIVTTNRGKAGVITLNYSGTVTFETIEDKAPMMNASEYLTWRRWAYHNMNPDAFPRGDQPTQETDETIFLAEADPYAWANIMKGWSSGTWNGDQVTSTDWTDFVTQTGVTQQHSISASGGTEKMKAYGSFGYLNQDGTQRGQKYTRYNTKLSVDIESTNWFSMGGSINASWSDQDYGMSTLGASSSSGPNSIYNASKSIFSYAVPYDDNGDPILTPGGDGNVYTIIDEWDKSTQQRQMFRAIGSFYAELDFGGMLKNLSGLKYRLNFGPDYRNWREGVYIDENSVNRLGGTSFARLKNQRDFSWTIDNIITYEKQINNHGLNVTLLQTASHWNIENSSMQGENIPRSDFLWNAFGTLDVTSTDSKVGIGSGLSERDLASYMGRINYSFNDRYLLTVSGRWDGASQLANGHKWSFFPSAALGWRMEQEPFMQSVHWVDQLKFRFGVGSTGNAAVSPYQTLGSIQSFFVPYGGADNTQAYATYEPNYTSTVYEMANEDLGWEVTTQYNLGIDFQIIKGRIGGAIDAYKSNTKDLLMSMTIPTLTGYSKTTANIGKTKNHGIDITLNTVNIDHHDFQWTSNINAAWQKDEIESLAYGKNDMVDNDWFIGSSISVIYEVDSDGLWQESDSEEMEKFNANGHDFEVGKAKPVDQNGDYAIDEKDRVIIGNTAPRWTMGFNNTFTYKGFELSMMLYGRFDYQVSTGGEAQLGRYNQRQIDYWTPDNTNAEFQKPIYNEAGGDAYSSTLGYRSGSFLKIRTISLGYNLPTNVIDRLGIQNMKIYAQAKNPGSIYSAIDWLDMDLGGSTYNRGFVLGVNVTF